MRIHLGHFGVITRPRGRPRWPPILVLIMGLFTTATVGLDFTIVGLQPDFVATNGLGAAVLDRRGLRGGHNFCGAEGDPGGGPVGHGAALTTTRRSRTICATFVRDNLELALGVPRALLVSLDLHLKALVLITGGVGPRGRPRGRWVVTRT